MIPTNGGGPSRLLGAHGSCTARKVHAVRSWDTTRQTMLAEGLREIRPANPPTVKRSRALPALAPVVPVVCVCVYIYSSQAQLGGQVTTYDDLGFPLSSTQLNYKQNLNGGTPWGKEKKSENKIYVTGGCGTEVRAAEAAKGCGPKTEVVWSEDRGGCGPKTEAGVARRPRWLWSGRPCGGGGRASTGRLRLEVTWQAWTEVRMGVPFDDGSEPSDRFSTKRGSPSYTRTDP